MGKVVRIAVAAAALLVLSGLGAPARGVCVIEVDGRCTNPCIETARAYRAVTGQDPPFFCLM